MSALEDRYEAEFSRSRALYLQAREVFPSGVTHDLRYLEPFPIYVHKAMGSRKWDVDDHELIDYWAGHGALLLGHCHPKIVAAVHKQMELGTHPGACHEQEIRWAELVRRLIPSAEQVRFTASGTEATLMALRLARIYTGKPRVLKFAGHFHGWHDAVTPGADGFDLMTPAGVSDEVAAQTVVIPPNDIKRVERALEADPSIGCVILEPTGGHWGAVPIRGPFLRDLRELTTRFQRLLIFDEVITGFRVSPGGAQAYYGVKPDLTALAKVLAGGLPGGCLAGQARVMASLEFRAGQRKLKHPGTFNANPLSAAAGIAALELVATREPCHHANEVGKQLRQGLNDLFTRRNLPWVAYGEFSIFRLIPNYVGPRPTDDAFIPFDGAFDKLEVAQERALVHSFRKAMLLNGVDLPGLAGMTTAVHTQRDVEQTLNATEVALDLLASSIE
jgi:glutamate-1-semialdehyde 2,1-aminomutase